MKKRYYCKRLNETLNFDALKVFYCCATRTGPSIDIPSPKRVKDIIKKRNSLIRMLDEGKIPAECKDCFDLHEQENPKPLLISRFSKLPKANLIIVKHFKQCDCACIYCCEQYLSKRKIVLKSKKSDYYDLLPIIEELYRQDIIDKKELDEIYNVAKKSIDKIIEMY